MSAQFVKNPNPQGKGLVPVLRDWQAMVPAVSGPKAAGEFLRDYCLSSLVLAAEFRFKPVVGKPYYLYATTTDWRLSMVAPHEWTGAGIGEYFARCTLRADMTWAVAPAEGLAEDAPAVRNALAFVEAFIDTLNDQERVGDNLPVYVRELPYYRRLLASALAASLKHSAPGDEKGLRSLLAQGGRDWALPAPDPDSGIPA
jgi:hypothetical protein